MWFYKIKIILKARLREGRSSVRFPVRARILSLLQNVQTGCRIDAASHSMSTEPLSSEARRSGREDSQSSAPPPHAEVKNAQIHPAPLSSFPPSFLSWLKANTQLYSALLMPPQQTDTALSLQHKAGPCCPTKILSPICFTLRLMAPPPPRPTGLMTTL